MLTVLPVMTSFLPPTHTHLYLPSLFAIWEALNSSVIDERLLQFAGELSVEHVASTFGPAGVEGGARWKDVGIWSEKQWTLLVGKGLGSMSQYYIRC
jgi:proteasome activator subunit 4